MYLITVGVREIRVRGRAPAFIGTILSFPLFSLVESLSLGERKSLPSTAVTGAMQASFPRALRAGGRSLARLAYDVVVSWLV